MNGLLHIVRACVLVVVRIMCECVLVLLFFKGNCFPFRLSEMGHLFCFFRFSKHPRLFFYLKNHHMNHRKRVNKDQEDQRCQAFVFNKVELSLFCLLLLTPFSM